MNHCPGTGDLLSLTITVMTCLLLVVLRRGWLPKKRRAYHVDTPSR
jgi:hypothetical protein